MNLEQLAKQEAIKQGFTGDVRLVETSDKPHFHGQINTEGMDKIEIGHNPEYEKKRKGKSQVVVTDITKHEVNHRGCRGYKGCPRTLELHAESFMEPMSEVLSDPMADVHYVANTLEDSILHADLGAGNKLDGIALFLEDVGDCAGMYTSFYQAHTMLNMFLWGNKKQKRLVQKYYTRDKEKRKKILEVFNNFVQKTGLKRLQRDKTRMRAFLNDENNWKNVATVYAQEFGKLMEPNYAMALPNHSGSGTKGNPKPDKKEGNEFDKKMYEEDFKRQRAQKAHYSGQKIPRWMDSFQALDLLYQSFARKIDIKVESYTEALKYPAAWDGRRKFTERDNLKHTVFGFDDKGKVELQKKREPIYITAAYKKRPKGFPEARFCVLDTSGSMKEAIDGNGVGRTNVIPWGDNCKYHYALLGWYGMLEYLKQNHLLQEMSVSLANFSSSTELAKGLENAKKLALKPHWGNTIISAEAVPKIFEGKGKLVFTVSDGEIQNWSAIKDDFMKRAKDHYYFHLQIGSGNATTEEMKANGLHVEYITSAKDLARKVIDLTDGAYRNE